MDLLPTSHQDFGSTAYWDKFFRKRGAKAFEWYGEYAELCGILHKYIKPADKVLVVGCGNSTLSADLYDVGHRNIVNIDISDVVIRQMSEKNEKDRPDMKFLTMDMLESSFEDGEFGVVLDKGTLDALMTDSSPEVVEKIDKMFAEILRVLRLGGRYVCITLAQQHILKKVIDYFSQAGCPVRACRVVEVDDDEPKEFHMPVFVFIITKFKKMPNMAPILEVSQFEDNVERLQSTDQLEQAVLSMQYYGVVRQRLNKREQLDEHISLSLYGAASQYPRYTLYVVDNKNISAKKFAVFIVPEGRETDWLFSTDAGREELAASAGFNRLVIAALHPDHTYAGMEEVQAELSAKVMELAPHNIGKDKVPFVTLGENINTRQIKYRGTSDISGDYIVEDIDVDGVIHRRLIFLKNSNLVQSENRMVKVPSGRKKNKSKKSTLKVDVGSLCSPHAVSMLAGFSLLEDCRKKIDSGLNALMVGLGGGSLPMFMCKFLTKLTLDVLELDPSVVQVARDWFSLTEDSRLRVHVCDGVKYITEHATKGAQYDVLLLDCDSKDSSESLSAPPKAFIKPDMLRFCDMLLKPGGLFIINLNCRCPNLKSTFLQDLRNIFKAVYIQEVPEYRNEIVYALPTSHNCIPDLNSDSWPAELQASVDILQTLISEGRAGSDVQELSSSIRDLKLC